MASVIALQKSGGLTRTRSVEEGEIAGSIASQQNLNRQATAIILVARSNLSRSLVATLPSFDAWEATGESEGHTLMIGFPQNHPLTNASTRMTSTPFLRLGTSAENSWLEQRIE